MASLQKTASKLQDKRKRNALVAEQTEIELEQSLTAGTSSSGEGRKVKRRKDKVRLLLSLWSEGASGLSPGPWRPSSSKPSRSFEETTRKLPVN